MKRDVISIITVLTAVCALIVVGVVNTVKLVGIISEPTKEPAPTAVRRNLAIDSYTSWWSTHGEYNEGDFHFSITGSAAGTMYLMNSINLEMQKKDFEYEYIDNLLSFYFEDGTKKEYKTSINKIGNLVLTKQNNPDLFHNCYRYSEYVIRPFSANEFTAFGCWYLYNVYDDYFETISLWHNNEGMYYNNEEAEPKPFKYDYSDYVLTLHFDNYIKRYTINHMGNVLEMSSKDMDTDVFMLRTYETILEGTYFLDSSSNDSLDIMTFSLGIHGKLYIDYDDGTITIYGTDDSWYVDRTNGFLGMYYNADEGKFDLEYHYYLTEKGLYLVELDYSDTHFLKKID